MKHLGSIVHSLLGGMRQDQATTQRKQIYRDWDRERRNALTPSVGSRRDRRDLLPRSLDDASTTSFRLADQGLPRDQPGGTLIGRGRCSPPLVEVDRESGVVTPPSVVTLRAPHGR